MILCAFRFLLAFWSNNDALLNQFVLWLLLLSVIFIFISFCSFLCRCNFPFVHSVWLTCVRVFWFSRNNCIAWKSAFDKSVYANLFRLFLFYRFLWLLILLCQTFIFHVIKRTKEKLFSLRKREISIGERKMAQRLKWIWRFPSTNDKNNTIFEPKSSDKILNESNWHFSCGKCIR